MNEINDNLEEIKQDQLDFNSGDQNKSQISKISLGYIYSKDDIDNLERINQSLQKMTPMLT